jgi:pyrimidine operon attenuation protein/uracil phosphoribosyltransferase
MDNKRTELVDSSGILNLIKRISHEILESSSDIKNLAIIGIKSRGDFIAKRVASEINKISSVEFSLGTIDVTFHRDDYRTNLGSPKVGISDINFDLNGRDIILIDDVLYTGRTIRAAMDEIFSYGRPKSIRLAVIVDRGHRELPIKAEFVGKNFPTADDEHIHVLIKEVDAEDSIYLEKES